MASAQVLPSSRKQEHLEAGKRRLEEFRKKKAAERAKKAASSNQIHASDLSSNEKKLVDAEVVRLENSEAVGSTSLPDALLNQPSLTENRDDKLLQFSQGSRQNSISAIDSSSDFSVDQSDGFSRDTGQTFAEENKQHKSFGGSVSDGPLGYSYNQEDDDRRTDSGVYGSIFGLSSRKSSALSTQASQEIDRSSSHSSLHGREESLRKDNAGSLNDLLFAHPDTSFAANMGTQNSNSFLAHNKPPSGWRNSSSNEDSIQLTTNVMGSPEIGSRMLEAEHLNGSKTSDLPERKLTSTFSESPSMESTSSQGYSSAAFSSSSNHVPLYSTVSETHPRRSRPSFLDSLSVPRAPSSLPSKSTEPEESVWKNQSKLNSMGAVNSTHLHHANDETVGPVSKLRTFPHHSPEDSSYTSLFASNAASHADGQSMENMPGFYLPRQDDGFAALEQHIEDLTQEKFSLQRSLEASRALAESLAADNSSLTESYNQQRSLVNQLRADMEQLQREINARLVELEAVKHEYSNAQLECNAADERAKLLASEVIGLEEKALRLRSNELKLEKQLEKSQEEVSSYKKKVSSLEKDRQDLQSTISALQEEKKMLQSKLWKASVKGDLSKNNANKKDKSTLTDDLDVIPEMLIQQMQPDRTHVGTDSSISLSPSEDLQLNIEASSAYIPPEQMRMITNINALISELQLEKEELLKTLASEASENSKLKDLNKELSRKLEVQTQRLELLTAQNMVQDNVPAKLPDHHYVNENTAYADEGDEVVERVLGWIMKLFPGGPSRRRTSKLL